MAPPFPPLAIVLRSRHASAGREHGFTLVELLISAVISSLVLLGALQLAVSNIRTTAKLAVGQRMQTGFARLSHLIETEVAEGRRLNFAGNEATTAGCGAGNNGIAAVFSIDVPVLLRDEPGAASTESRIYYYSRNGDLWRCGPAILAEGTLNPANISAGRVLDNAQLSVQNTTPTQMQYRVQITDLPNSAAAFDSLNGPGWLFARTKAFRIQ